MRTGRVHVDCDGPGAYRAGEVAIDFEEAGVERSPGRRAVGIAFRAGDPYHRRLIRRRAIEDLKRLGYAPGEIAAALGISDRTYRHLASQNRSLAEASGRV